MSIMKIKWILVENAPLTASGQDEILAGAQAKKVLLQLAKLNGITVYGGRYSIIRVEPDTPKAGKCEVCGHEYDSVCTPDPKHPGYSFCGRKKEHDEEILENAYKNLINPNRNSTKEKK